MTETLEKKLESATGALAKRWHWKLGVASFFLGYTSQAIDHLKRHPLDVLHHNPGHLTTLFILPHPDWLTAREISNPIAAVIISLC